MDELMCAQPSRGTNAFHAGQEIFEFDQASHNSDDDAGGGKLENPLVDPVDQESGVEGHNVLEQVAGVDGNDEGLREPLAAIEPEDADEDDIIPWEATPPPPRIQVPQAVKRKFRAASSTPSLIASGSSSSYLSSKRQRVSGSAALYAINDQFSEFTDVFRTASQSHSHSQSQSQSQLPPIVLSPQRKQAAMRRAQELEKHLDDDSMAALIEAFQMDVSAADAYMVMLDDGPRKSFVERKIKHVNQQLL